MPKIPRYVSLNTVPPYVPPTPWVRTVKEHTNNAILTFGTERRGEILHAVVHVINGDTKEEITRLSGPAVDLLPAIEVWIEDIKRLLPTPTPSSPIGFSDPESA